ncbi:MAG: flagellar biosynthesis protein FlhA, partial [Pseudomonadota bacterium]
MLSIYIKNPSDFSTFPSVILIGTAFRLSLSIATTRLILSEAEAGEIITTFGEFVISGSVLIGLVIFLIITVVQFIVVTKGAERVAEVGARFALDSLPGKQMTIEAELRANNITPEEATEARLRLDRDSRFFGAMDGAMKFIKGDSIAGIIIIFINLLGGIAVGMTVHGFTFGEAISVYSLLTIGDGLVAQIPALLMSLCAGIVVTRTNGDKGVDLGSDISAELIADPRVPAVGAPIVLGIGLIPGFPFVIFATLAVSMVFISYAVRRSIRDKADKAALDAELKAKEEKEAEAAGADLPESDQFRLVVGEGLAVRCDVDAIALLMVEHINQFYISRGVQFPKIAVSVCSDVRSSGFVVEINEVPVFRATVPDDMEIFEGPGMAAHHVANPDHQSVAWTGFVGTWIPQERAEAVAQPEFWHVPLEEAIARQAFRIYEENIGSMFSNEVFTRFIDAVTEQEPKLMDDINKAISLPLLQTTLQYLIEDGVPLRPTKLFAQSLSGWLANPENATPAILADCMRVSLKRQMCHLLSGNEGVLGLALVGPKLEKTARTSLQEEGVDALSPRQDGLILSPEVNDSLVSQVRELMKPGQVSDRQVVLVVSPDLRRRFRNHLAGQGCHLPVF